jgi:hypothetical protein
MRENGLVTDATATGSTDEGELQDATVRRAPRYGAFIAVGALVGFLVTAIVTMQFPADPNVGLIASLAYFSLFGVSAGIALGALMAIVFDRRSLKRTRSVRVEHAEVGEPFQPDAETPSTS